jgi:hypothetical protein
VYNWRGEEEERERRVANRSIQESRWKETRDRQPKCDEPQYLGLGPTAGIDALSKQEGEPSFTAAESEIDELENRSIDQSIKKRRGQKIQKQCTQKSKDLALNLPPFLDTPWLKTHFDLQQKE